MARPFAHPSQGLATSRADGLVINRSLTIAAL
jgi:hypothetical protein